jgi:hypothetical protein
MGESHVTVGEGEKYHVSIYVNSPSLSVFTDPSDVITVRPILWDEYTVVGLGFERKIIATTPTTPHRASKRPTPIMDPEGIPRTMGTIAANEHDERKLNDPCGAK